MDSKIREALVEIAKQEQDNCYGTMNPLADAMKIHNALRRCGDIARTLLTAEPEPPYKHSQAIGDAAIIGEAIKKLHHWASGYAGATRSLSTEVGHNALMALDRLIYASQVTDKRAEELRAQVQILKGLIVESWGVLTDKDLVSYDPWEGYVDDIIARLDIAGRPDEALAATEPKT